MIRAGLYILLAPVAMLALKSNHAARPTTALTSGERPIGASEPPGDESSSPQGESAVSHAGTSDARRRELDLGAEDKVSNATRGVLGGPHDFSRSSGRVQDACSACHVPHVVAVRSSAASPGDAERPALDAPRESRGAAEPQATTSGGAPAQPTAAPEAQAPSASAALELYRIGGQRQVYAPGRFMPGPTSLICLSCHDGAVAPSALGTSHALLSTQRLDFTVPDGFVWHDHPIGIVYPNHRKGYRSLSEVERLAGLRLPEGRVECVSCHDPHGASGEAKLLSTSNRRSALCLGCHEK